MSDVSGIPYMGPMGQGNFFAPQFPANPQINPTAGYAAPMAYNQSVTNNLFAPGGGFGRQTDYYSGLGASYSAAGMSPYGVFNDPGTGPSQGGGGSIFDQGAANNFMTSGGGYSFPSIPDYSSFGGGGGGDVRAPSIDWGNVGRAANDLYGGAQQNPLPNMSMPGGLGSPLSAPSGSSPFSWSDLWSGGGSKGGGGYTSGIAPDTAGGFTAPSSPMTTLSSGGPSWEDVPTATPTTPTMPSSERLLGYTPDTLPAQPQEQAPFDFTGSNTGGGNAPVMPSSERLLGYTPQQQPAEFDPNTFQSPPTNYEMFQGPAQGGGGDTDVSSSNKSAEQIANEARERLAGIIGSPETAEAVEKANERVPLPRERPEGADAPRPPADVAPQDMTYLRGKGPGDLKGVNQRFSKALQEFTREYNAAQGDYSIALRSGLRPGDPGVHGKGKAIDINLIDRRTGERLNDYQTRDPTVFKAYQDNANQFHTFLEKNYPDLASMHRWGGYFWNGGPGHYGSQDIMHHDLAGDRIGTGAGSWKGGLSQQAADAYGLPTGGGFNTPWPQFTFDWSNAPIKDAPAISPTYKSPEQNSKTIYQLAPDGTRIPVPIGPGLNETTEYDPFRGTQLGGTGGAPTAPRPPADIPNPAPAAPAGPSGVEKAQTFLNTPVDSLLRQYQPDKAGVAGMFIDTKQSLREALKGPYGGQILDGLQPRLGEAGLKRDDLAKAIANPAARIADFPVGDGGRPIEDDSWTPQQGTPEWNTQVYQPSDQRGVMHRDETTTDGGWGAFAKPGNVEDRRTEQLSSAQLSGLKARGFGYAPMPEVASSSLGAELGLGDLPMPRGMTAAAAPGFFGNDETIANRQVMPGDLTSRWNELIYEGVNRPTMAREESLGADPNPFKDFRQSENFEDRRLDPQLTDEQKANILKTAPPRGTYWPTSDKIPEGGRLGEMLGTSQIGNLEANATMRIAAEPASNGRLPMPTRVGDFDGAEDQPVSRDDLAKTMTFGGGFSPSPEPRRGGVGPEVSLEPDFMDVIQEVESSGNADKQNKGSQYKGLYQLNDTEFRKYGGQGDIFDPEQNTLAAGAKMVDETQRVQDILGRALTPPEQYMVHQQGVAGSLAHLANPDQLAWKNFQSASGRSEAGAKEAIWINMTKEMQKQFGNDVNNVTSRDFLRLWEDRYYGILNR